MYYMNEGAFDLLEAGYVDRTVHALETRLEGGSRSIGGRARQDPRGAEPRGFRRRPPRRGGQGEERLRRARAHGGRRGGRAGDLGARALARGRGGLSTSTRRTWRYSTPGCASRRRRRSPGAGVPTPRSRCWRACGCAIDMARRGDIGDESPEERTQPVRMLGGSSRLRRAEGEGGGRVLVSSDGPFAVGSITWRDQHSRLQHTIVAKLAFELSPGVCSVAHEPIAIEHDDGHWDDDPGKSVHVPSDLAPFKAAPEVVVVGNANAASDQLRTNVTARVLVGSVDKSVVAWVPRKFRSDGSIRSCRGSGGSPCGGSTPPAGQGRRTPRASTRTAPTTAGGGRSRRFLPPVFEVQRAGEFVPTVACGSTKRYPVRGFAPTAGRALPPSRATHA